MTKKEALENVLSEILEERGFISLHIGQFKKDFSPVTKEEAKNKAYQVAEILGLEVKESEGEGMGTFLVNSGINVRLAFSYVMEEVTENAG